MSTTTAIFVMLAGAFAIAGGILNWDWFMEHRRARIFVRLLGRQGARVLYALLGVAIIGLGVVSLLTGR